MFKRLIIVLTFLTRIPIPVKSEFREKDLGRTTGYFPLVGLLISIPILGTTIVFSRINAQLGAIAGVITGILVTGGLHLDGLMDTADGLFSARTRERILEIMKDSRVGAHGVTAAVVVLLTKYVIYQALITEDDYLWALPLGLIFSRWMMVFSILNFPAARKEGLGHIFIKYKTWWDFPVATGAVIIAAIILSDRWFSFVPLWAAFLISWLWCRSVHKKLGGLTGDIYGALAEFSEILFLFLLLVTEKLIMPHLL